MSILEVTLKLLLAIALGGLIGVERETSQKPAGFRTNILICLGATMMMVLSMLVLEGKEGSSGDLMRMAAGVITGIGFIGAGTIIQARGMITGLTTAATLWAVAGLGLIIGAGYYVIAIIFTGIITLTLVIFRRFEGLNLKKDVYRYSLKSKSKDTLNNIKKLAIHEGIRFQEIKQKKDDNSFIIQFTFSSTEEKEQKFYQTLSNLREIVELKID